MKNQYFGDINDYRKYGLLRVLARASRLSIGVCWMLTPDDGRADGGKDGYLGTRNGVSRCDPELFSALKRLRHRKNVDEVRTCKLIPGATFYRPALSDSRNQRERYFREALESFRKQDLIFFDPDNGLEVPSKPLGRKGRRGSAKYLYWEELRQALEAGHSALVYQHFCRKARSIFLRGLRRRVAGFMLTAWVKVLQTPHVAFLLAVQPRHSRRLEKAVAAVARRWPASQICVR